MPRSSRPCCARHPWSASKRRRSCTAHRRSTTYEARRSTSSCVAPPQGLSRARCTATTRTAITAIGRRAATSSSRRANGRPTSPIRRDRPGRNGSSTCFLGIRSPTERTTSSSIRTSSARRPHTGCAPRRSTPRRTRGVSARPTRHRSRHAMRAIRGRRATSSARRTALTATQRCTTSLCATRPRRERTSRSTTRTTGRTTGPPCATNTPTARSGISTSRRDSGSTASASASTNGTKRARVGR